MKVKVAKQTPPDLFWGVKQGTIANLSVVGCATGVAISASNKEEETMRTETQEQRYHLTDRLEVLHDKKVFELEKAFGLVDDERPYYLKDFVERIQKGMFVLPDHPERHLAEECSVYDISWRDPSVKQNQEGFQKASNILRDAYLAAKDDIMIRPVEEGLKTLRAFEAQDFR